MFDQTSSRRRFLVRSGSAIGISCAGGMLLRGAPAAAQTGVVTFKLAHPDTNKHPSQQVAQRFAAQVAQASNGRFKIDIYPLGTLGSEQNIVQGLQTGIIDFALHTSGFLESFVPTMQVVDLPFIFKDDAAAQRALDGEVGKQLAADMLSRNLVQLAWGHYGWREVETTDKVVTVPADMNGLKIRIQPGPVFTATFKAVDAIPVVIDAADTYIALQQKTVGAVEFPVLAYYTNKIYEVAKNLAKTNHVYNVGVLMASKPKFDALAPADQALIRTAGADQTPFWRALVAKAGIDYEKQCVAAGTKVTNTNYAAFHAAMAPVYAEFKPKYPDLYDKAVAANG